MIRVVVPAAALLIATPTHADTIGNWRLKPHDPLEQPPKQWPDGPLKRFFQHLQRPDNHLRPQYDENQLTSCCGASDVVDTKFKVEPGNGPDPEDTWYALLKGKWVRIPPEKIVPEFAPDGNAYLFVLTFYSPQDDAYDEQIVCFVRPNGGN